MPTEFQFLNKETRKAIKLPEIDDEIRLYSGDVPNAQTFSTRYDFIVLTGMACLSKSGKSEIEEDTLEEYLAQRTEFTDEDKAMMMKFLAVDYIFTAWYNPRR